MQWTVMMNKEVVDSAPSSPIKTTQMKIARIIESKTTHLPESDLIDHQKT
jgi:hypothetical protein